MDPLPLVLRQLRPLHLAPTLNVADFICFQAQFAAGNPAANCDGSTTPPTLNITDFICFQQAFAAGCP